MEPNGAGFLSAKEVVSKQLEESHIDNFMAAITIRSDFGAQKIKI